MKTSRNTYYIYILLSLCLALSGTSQASARCPRMDGMVAPLDDNPPEGTTAYYELNIRAHIKSGNWDAAKVLLDEAIKKYPHMSAFNELMGKYFVHAAEVDTAKALPNYDKARYYLIRAITIDEKNVQARFSMLQVETETQHYSSAIVYCNELLEENPYNEDLWRKKIDLYRRLGNNAEADRLLERICTIYPGDDNLVKDLIYRKSELVRKQRANGDLQGMEQTLRELVKAEPRNPEHHRALVAHLYRTGRVAEAADAAAHAASMTNLTEFVEKRSSMLCEMNRHREAAEYVRSFSKMHKTQRLQKLLAELDLDAARAAQYNDAYIHYAKIYDSQGSIEALDYLVNTSIERWYLDDALMYVQESLKRKGESKKMLYNEYLIQKRLGNTRRANSLLTNLYEKFPDDQDISEEMMVLWLDMAKEQMDLQHYDDAVPILEKVYFSEAYPYLKDAAFHRLYTCYFLTKKYEKVEGLLSHLEGTKQITQTAVLYNAWGKPKKALDYLAKAYNYTSQEDKDARKQIAYTYEEIALPYIKSLLNANRVADAEEQLREAVEICPTNAEILRYGITATQRRGDTAGLKEYVARGRNQYPDDPYFIIKEAQLRHLSGDHRATLDEIKPLLKEYSGDSVLIALYVESSIDIAKQLLASDVKQPDEALLLIQSALEIDPDNPELYYMQGQAYEQKKEWQKAYESYKKYKPGYAELAEHRHHLEELSHHTLKNTLSLEYQQARPGDVDVISSNAHLDYSHTFAERTTLSVGFGYAGRDGATDVDDTEMTRGGTGIQGVVGIEHAFTSRFTAKAEVGGATRYFPIILGRLSFGFDLGKDWQLSFLACYRMLRSYSGRYDWTYPIVGYDTAGNPIYGEAEYARVGWNESKNHMLQAGIGVSKTLGKFELGADASGFYFDRRFFFNSSLKMKFYPVEGNKSHIFAVGGVGTAPESTLIDRSLPVGFNKLNTFVGLGGSYFINRWLSLNLSGSWYTMLDQAERLTTSYIATDPYIKEDYRNYFYINASAVITF